MAYQQITFAQLKARLAALTESTPFWTDTEAGLFINEGLRFWNLLTGRWKTTVVLQTSPVPTREYALPNSLLYRTRGRFNNLPMTSCSYESLTAAHPRWYTETTATGGDVPTRPTLWVPLSLRMVIVWPMDAVGHNSLTFDGVSDTPTLVADGQYVDLAEADVSNLLAFALHIASFKKGGAWFAQTAPSFARFLAAASEQNQILNTSDEFRRYAGLVGADEQPIRSASAPAGLVMEPGR